MSQLVVGHGFTFSSLPLVKPATNRAALAIVALHGSTRILNFLQNSLMIGLQSVLVIIL